MTGPGGHHRPRERPPGDEPALLLNFRAALPIESLAEPLSAGGAADAARFAGCDPAAARLTRLLAASKPGATALHICHSPYTGELAVWMHAGLDIGSKLVCAAADATTAYRLHALFDADIRVSVTAQSPMGFIADVSPNHRFDLVVVEGTACAEDLEQLISTLQPGGLLVVSNPDEQACKQCLDQPRGQRLVVTEPRASEAWLVTRLTAMPPRRRGGRAGRQRS